MNKENTTGIVWKELFNRYFEGENSSGSVTSSHWRNEEETYQLNLDEKTGKEWLTCRGIGPVRWRKAKQKSMDCWCRRLHLLHLPDSGQIRKMEERLSDVMKRMEISMTLDVFRHVCSAYLLDKFKPEEGYHRILMIGDGYGVLGAFLKELNPSAQIVFIDLGKTLAIQANMMEAAFEEVEHQIADASGAAGDFTYCPAEKLEYLTGLKFDLAVNVASMQEMDPTIVSAYFSFLRKHLEGARWFYCCNREKKVLPDGEISAFMEYPWMEEDEVELDGPCPWHQYFLSKWPARNGAHILGWRLPWVNYYDGVHRHRMVKLKKSE